MFALAEHVKVKDATYSDGILAIKLLKEIPEAEKPIEIKGLLPRDPKVNQKLCRQSFCYRSYRKIQRSSSVHAIIPSQNQTTKFKQAVFRRIKPTILGLLLIEVGC